MKQYQIITITQTKTINDINAKSEYRYTNQNLNTKRVRFFNDVIYYQYEYKPLTFYKSSLKYCMKRVSKIINAFN